MKLSAWRWLLVLGCGALFACDGTPSPATNVTCSVVPALTLVGPGTHDFVVVQTVLLDDPGNGGAQVALNNAKGHVFSDSAEVQVCTGACANPATDVDVTTNDLGILSFTVRITSPGGVAGTGTVIETWGASPSNCLIQYAITP